MKQKYLFLFFALSFFSSLVFSSPLLATEKETFVKLGVPLPNPATGGVIESVKVCDAPQDVRGGGKEITCNGIGQYITDIYKWLIGAVALLSVLVFMYAGFLWLTARGDTQQVSGAQKTLQNGLAGFILAIGSYALLWAINPNLVEFLPLKLDATEKIELEFKGSEDRGMAVGGGGGVAVTGFSRLFFKPGPKNDLENTGSGVTNPGEDWINGKVKLLLTQIDAHDFGFPLTVTSMRGGRRAPADKRGSHHTNGRAFDIGTDTAHLQKLVEVAKFLKANRYSMNIDELFFTDNDGKTPIMDAGNDVSWEDYKNFDDGATFQDHKDHLHVAVKP